MINLRRLFRRPKPEPWDAARFRQMADEGEAARQQLRAEVMEHGPQTTQGGDADDRTRLCALCRPRADRLNRLRPVTTLQSIQPNGPRKIFFWQTLAQSAQLCYSLYTGATVCAGRL